MKQFMVLVSLLVASISFGEVLQLDLVPSEGYSFRPVVSITRVTTITNGGNDRTLKWVALEIPGEEGHYLVGEPVPVKTTVDIGDDSQVRVPFGPQAQAKLTESVEFVIEDGSLTKVYIDVPDGATATLSNVSMPVSPL